MRVSKINETEYDYGESNISDTLRNILVVIFGLIIIIISILIFSKKSIWIDNVEYEISLSNGASVVNVSNSVEYVNIPEQIVVNNIIYPVKRIKLKKDSFNIFANKLKSLTIPNSVKRIDGTISGSCPYLAIYCKMATKPPRWSSLWNDSNCHVYWGINDNNFIEIDNLQYLLDLENQTASLIMCVGAQNSIEIPSRIEHNSIEYTVISIGEGAFYDCKNLTSVKIPNSVTSIGFSAFYNCFKLENITLPFVGNSLDGEKYTHFGYIFGARNSSNNCDYVPPTLKEVIITGGTSIANFAFAYCNNLISIEIQNSVISIGTEAFYSCYSLSSFIIPKSVTSIGESVFSNCISLTIYCEASEMPFGWSSLWNDNNCPVVWGFRIYE